LSGKLGGRDLAECFFVAGDCFRKRWEPPLPGGPFGPRQVDPAAQ